MKTVSVLGLDREERSLFDLLKSQMRYSKAVSGVLVLFLW